MDLASIIKTHRSVRSDTTRRVYHHGRYWTVNLSTYRHIFADAESPDYYHTYRHVVSNQPYTDSKGRVFWFGDTGQWKSYERTVYQDRSGVEVPF